MKTRLLVHIALNAKGERVGANRIDAVTDGEVKPE